jgi:hypothetical protein
MRDGAEVGGGANGEVCIDSLLTLMTRLKTRYERVPMEITIRFIMYHNKPTVWFWDKSPVPITHEEWDTTMHHQGNGPVSEAAQQN